MAISSIVEHNQKYKMSSISGEPNLKAIRKRDSDH